tara:strand:- start:77647 stop:78033 length:387 start_codon:yes stop_codon:yes gene_type:complete
MGYVAIVCALALIQYTLFGFAVGKARQTYGVKAPANSGHIDFERVNRVHANTGEQLLSFIPGLWMFAYFVNAEIAAALGVVYLIGRQIYSSGYTKAADQRGRGMIIGFIPTVILVLGALVGGVMHVLG